MEMNERIKVLRKSLKMTQEEFGKRLGVTRDTIGNIELNRLARPDQKLSLIKLMCKEFNVNEDWILDGIEPMFVQPSAFSLDRFAKERGMNEQDLRILKLYFSIDPQKRHDAINYFLNGLLDEPIKRFLPKTAAELEAAFPPEEDASDKVG